MELLDHLVLGMNVALQPSNIFFCFVGALLGTLIGVLPGVGPAATIAILLPITYSLSPATSIIMLAGIYYGAQYGGSTTAIMINLPGETSSVVTAIDGYQMARKGRAGAALAIAAIGSLFAGTVSTFVLALFSVPLSRLALSFSAPDYFALMVLGMLACIALASGSLVKALGMSVVGMLAGLIGTDIYTGSVRLNFGLFSLADGLSVVAIAAGVFGLSEIIRNTENETGEGTTSLKRVGSLMPTREEMRRSVGPVIRGTGIGTVLGILPGGGAALASFAAYVTEKRLSRRSHEFGKGAVEGVAAPESANNAGAQMSFLPMLTLGIPSNPLMALFIAALILQGIVPGPNVLNAQPELFWGLIASMWVGNIILVILNLPLIGLWVRLLTIPYHLLFPAIVVFAVFGVYGTQNSVADLAVMAFFGGMGYLFVRFGCELAPFILGFILGPMLEEYLRRSLIQSRGDFMIFVERPISAVLLGLALVLIIVASLPSVVRRRRQVFSEE
ncbi:tripartite tricarboxylate transporter permease [Rhizobiaceae bacterium BDR2-2]|uniref:Tripartite tricarboxylate transporter permease n=1 Tax=Ectorhizobium quercum TaxID=2965071 RepID=A0AAE3MY83_9HYPH|nr:tripartite tricarboxylate transporter permease [Ectorhizobium quercum]MCX8997428.1 tripartite tricarboxylate transporter permease [Ectorhizobium quercum]